MLTKRIRQEVQQTRKRGRKLLRKIAADPLSVLGNVREVLPQVTSQLHDYPALQAITEAISVTERQEKKLEIPFEDYQAELVRLEAQDAQREAQQQRTIAFNVHLENLLEIWQSGGKVTEISPEIIDEMTCYLETSEGKGYLGAVTDSPQVEDCFHSWLMGKTIEQSKAIDLNQLLQQVLEHWRIGREIPISEREFVAHYIQLPAGKGTLSALAEDGEEQQCFCTWLFESETVAASH